MRRHRRHPPLRSPRVPTPSLPPPPSSHADAVQHHLRRPRLSLILVSAVGSARALPGPLVVAISGFLTRKYWAVESASERGDLRLLQRVIACEAPSTHPLYRDHIFSLALAGAAEHDNAIELFECLRAYYPDGDANAGVEQAISGGKTHVLEWISANLKPVAWDPIFASVAAEENNLGVLLWLKKTFPESAPS